MTTASALGECPARKHSRQTFSAYTGRASGHTSRRTSGQADGWMSEQTAGGRASGRTDRNVKGRAGRGRRGCVRHDTHDDRERAGPMPSTQARPTNARRANRRVSEWTGELVSGRAGERVRGQVDEQAGVQRVHCHAGRHADGEAPHRIQHARHERVGPMPSTHTVDERAGGRAGTSERVSGCGDGQSLPTLHPRFALDNADPHRPRPASGPCDTVCLWTSVPLSTPDSGRIRLGLRPRPSLFGVSSMSAAIQLAGELTLCTAICRHSGFCMPAKQYCMCLASPQTEWGVAGRKRARVS
ncbi:uncharacterized protein B0H18DRAFT_141781 [Fomitopsis serialis]|uniref:uncharacterized protein n=1 Tax=Fomitopsis serialis TaxID=139415 RepID=UPI0020078AFF|nr:uncharacterized protein B0H18DRAFT_141781 [Neoantrodia serialis]KAH9914143.1 hypothetical protein B0H18DRAFT_141781 [Neoantrodia serialis]